MIRNPFGTLISESVAGLVEGILKRFDERLARTELQPIQALPYSKTASDAMRVNVENQTPVTPYVGGSSSSINGAVNAPLWFNPTAILMVDEREQQRLQSEINFNNVVQRWTFS